MFEKIKEQIEREERKGENIMREIINGKKYDTDTAKVVGRWSNGYSYCDFEWCCETLHRKRTGEFFIHGEGGAMTTYAECCGDNSYCGGERIIPISEDDAKKWCERNCDADEYEKIFGEVAE